MSTEDIATEFVRMGLAINEHFPGYVDSYYGPHEIAQAIQDEGKRSLTDLEALANDFAYAITSNPSVQPDRREYLLSELAAMHTTLRILQGESPGIIEEVRRLYGVTPDWVEESSFAEAHQALAAILPGTDPVSERVRVFREKMRIPVQVAAPIIMRLGATLQERVRARFPLPSQENCEFAFVREKPWLAYNWYFGASTSRIDFNEDRPIFIHQLPYVVAHESYPGHHTEHAIKEEKLYRKEGRLEHAILLNNTPSALVSEGIAMNALEAIMEPEEIVAIYRDILKEAGIPVQEAPRVREFVLAQRPLGKVSDNQLLLLHRDGAPDEEVIAYGIRYGLSTDELERQSMEFLKDPLWRSYGFNYTLGRQIVESYLSASTDRLEAFSRLLQSPLTPGQVVAATTQ